MLGSSKMREVLHRRIAVISMGTVIKARNIIFVEGPSHLILQLPPADFFPEPTLDTPALLLSDLHCVSHPGQPIAPQVRPTNPPLHSSHLAESATPPVPTSTTLPSTTPTLHRSPQNVNPMAGSRAAEEALNRGKTSTRCMPW